MKLNLTDNFKQVIFVTVGFGAISVGVQLKSYTRILAEKSKFVTDNFLMLKVIKN